jgi:hypothetical protein
VAKPHDWIEAGGGALFQSTPFYSVTELLRELLVLRSTKRHKDARPVCGWHKTNRLTAAIIEAGPTKVLVFIELTRVQWQHRVF